MVLPKAIGRPESDRLLEELLYAWKNTDEDIAFPSDDWFDNQWIYDPGQRNKVRDIMSALMEHFTQSLDDLQVAGFVRMSNYNRISYNGGYLCIHK